MKHAREDYNRIQDPAGLIPENEPVFLLRAQDKHAPEVVAFWASLVHREGGDGMDPWNDYLLPCPLCLGDTNL